MLEFDWNARANPKVLSELLERRKLTGGRIVVFKRVASFIFVSRSSDHYCLVGEHESRAFRGLLFFLPTFFTGWWSPSGFLATFYALAHDLLGGVDVTEQIDDPKKPRDKKNDEFFAGARFLLTIFLMACVLVPIFGWVAYHLPDQAHH
jgi:hypothetical protein